MCRSIKPLANLAPPATADEVHAAALQYVRKVSGSIRPSRANEAVFSQAVAEVAATTAALLATLTTATPPRDRALLAAAARARAARRERPTTRDTERDS